MTRFTNFGDISPDHGQTWIAFGGDDYAVCVEIISGSDISLADNQYLIKRGSIYFSPHNWNAALEAVGFDIIGPPEYLEIAYAFNVYHGYDRDHWGGFEIVQIGKIVNDWCASGTACAEPDKVLHGNTSISRYLESEWLQ